LRLLGLAVEVLPFLEAEVRAYGDAVFTDEVVRLTVGLSLWLELPVGLVVFAGHPVFPE